MGGYKSKVTNLGNNCDLNLNGLDANKFPTAGGEYTCTTNITNYKTEWYINDNPIYVRYGTATIQFNYNTEGIAGGSLGQNCHWGVLIKSTDGTVTKFNFLDEPKTQTQTLTFDNIDVSKNYIILLIVSRGSDTDTRSYFGQPDYIYNDGRDWYFYALTTKLHGASTDRVVFNPYVGRDSYGRKELFSLSPQTIYTYNICCSGLEFERTAGDDQEFGRQLVSYSAEESAENIYCLWNFIDGGVVSSANLRSTGVITDTAGYINTGLKLRTTTEGRASHGTVVLKGTNDMVVPNFPRFN